MWPINIDVVATTTTKMSDYVQHVLADPPPTIPTSIVVKVECEKSGTIYWERTSTGERAWSKEALSSKE